MSIIEQSAYQPITDYQLAVYREQLRHLIDWELPIWHARLSIARMRLGMEIRGELLAMGASTDESVVSQFEN